MKVVFSAALLLPLTLLAMTAYADPAEMNSSTNPTQSLILQAKPGCVERCQQRCRGKHPKCLSECLPKCR